MGKEFEYVFDVAGATTGEVRQGPVNDDERNKVVYLHRRADDGLPFYIGIGNVDRPYVTTKRNDYWTKVYKKHGRTVEILYSGLTFDEACAIEIRLIKEYREKYPEYLVNLTDGGEGTIGLTGEDACNFKGHVLFLSLCEKYYFICSGAKELEDAGFHNTGVYNTLTGSKNYESVSSKKIHIDGIKIRFKPMRFNSVDDIDDELLKNRVEAVVCEDKIVGKAGENNYCFGRTGELHPMFGRTGESGGNFKGYSLGVSQTHFVLLAGNKDMELKKFHPGNISSCISGKLNHHKGFKWFRIDENITQESLKTLRDLQPFDQDSAERLEELLK